MLKGISPLISPELLKALCEMGHGDELVIGDGNFPGASHAKNLIRLDGHNVPEILEAMLKLFPLDSYAPPVYLMEKVPGDTVETPIWDTYREIIGKYTDAPIEFVERFEFYERAKKAYAVVMSGEGALYANVILKKGVVTE